jgi:predicted Zn-dependent protease
MAASALQGLAAVVAACLLTACETQPLQREVPGLALEAPLPPAPTRTWADTTQDVNNHRIGGWGLVAMPAMQAYLNGLYRQLKTQGGHPEWPGEVYVMADPSLKSTSTAAGNIYLSLGWLQSMESEDEVFALLAHEFGHVYLGHHIIYEATNAGDITTRLATVGVALANRTTQATGLNGAYASAALRAVAGSALVPAWKRSTEEEADRFGATFSLRANYSYPRGFKTFLERIATYDDDQREKTDKARTDTERQEREASLRAVEERARQQQGNTKDITGLQGGANALELKLNEGLFNISAALKRSIETTAARVQETHGDAVTREDNLSKAVLPTLATRPRPTARTASWEAVRHEAGTAEILAHYELQTKVSEALARNAYAEALKLAAQGASGRTANDALPLYTLRTVTLLAKPGTSVADLDRRQLAATERSWMYVFTVIKETAQANRSKARAMLEQQLAYFQKAPALWPDVIAFYRSNGYLDEARAMANTCVLQHGAYREACIDSARTDEEKKAMAAASEQKAKEIADRWGSKLKIK